MTTIYNGHKITQSSNVFYVDDNTSIAHMNEAMAKEHIDMVEHWYKKAKARRYATFGTGFVNLEPRDQQHLETQFKL